MRPNFFQHFSPIFYHHLPFDILWSCVADFYCVDLYMRVMEEFEIRWVILFVQLYLWICLHT